MHCLNTGREEEARKMLAAHLKKHPMDVGANKLMAMICGAHDDFEQALTYLRRAEAAEPKNAEIKFMLGNTLLAIKRYAEAVKPLEACWGLSYHDPQVALGLSQALISSGRLDDAMRALNRSIEATPDDANTYGNASSVMIAIGNVGEAMEVVRRGYARLPNATGLLESLVQNTNFIDNVDPVEHRKLHEKLAATWLGYITRAERVLGNTNERDRVLRVGFLSADYGYHACAMFMRAALTNFDHGRIVPYAYSCRQWNDGYAEVFKQTCVWRDVSGLDHDQTAAAIIADGIDILVDCSGHFSGNRLPALMPRVAPIQCTWLGYPNTTGLPTMDYRIVDRVTDPPAMAGHTTEQLARLPDCFLCFSPNPNAPAVGQTGAGRDDRATHITFGSFNRLDKATPSTLDAWCRVLRAVPDSRMMLKSRMMTEELQRMAIGRFSSRGIEPHRIVPSDYVSSAEEHLGMYNKVDIALDTFPYNGTTTTCEATWMGVPVVTLAGEMHRARVGASLNTVVGLPQLIGRDVDQYVNIAVGLAADWRDLAALKGSLRGKMAASALCDAPAYARKFEVLLRTMWIRWCKGEPPAPI